ncbi:MAG: DUF4011 domain-containing protein, partial [Nitrospinota bacterium]|nr:DUF4011 domain-containing protein [Nitrospinota bacterium]
MADIKPPNQNALRTQIRTEIGTFRKKLLDLGLRNPLLSFSHREPSSRHFRIIDELPDQVFGGLLNGTEFGILPLSVPQTQPDDEDTEEFQAALADLKDNDPVYLDSLASLERQRASSSEFETLERRARDRVRLDLGIERWTPESDLSPEDLARRRGL